MTPNYGTQTIIGRPIVYIPTFGDGGSVLIQPEQWIGGGGGTGPF